MDYLNLSLTQSNHSGQYLTSKDIDVWNFLTCLQSILLETPFKSLAAILFTLGIISMNILVIYYLNRYRKNKTVFDKIFIAHAFVDLLIGIFVVPFYLIYTLFGHWPLGRFMCTFYVALDYIICHVGILHMVFISYARLRSVLHPQKYKQEFFISKTKSTITLLWLVSIFIWLPTVYLQSLNYKLGECYLIFNPFYVIVQDLLAYLIPIIVITLISIFILNRLRFSNRFKQRPVLKNGNDSNGTETSVSDLKQSANMNSNLQKKNVNSNKSKSFFDLSHSKINVNTKLYIILTTFCLLWLPFCILWPIASICFDCVPTFIYQTSYWMGYAQSLINPIILLILTKPETDRKYARKTQSIMS